MVFTKRVMSKTKKVFIYGGGSLILFFALLLSLSYLGIDVQTSGDQVCGDTCISYFNISLKEYSLCFGSTFKGVMTEPNVTIEIYKADSRYRSDNPNRWKQYNFTANKCLDKNKTHEFKIIGYKKPEQIVKWGLSLSGKDVDPFWYNSTGGATGGTSVSTIYLELGSQVNITANLSGASTVCVDIDHPSYNNSYACGTPSANFLFNITFFRNNQFNDTNVTKNVSWNNGGNQSVYIKQHQYDEIVNASLNITGFINNGTYPINIKIYINNTLSNDIGTLSNKNITITQFVLTTNVSTLTGESTEGWNSSGKCSSSYPCSNAYDRNWDNYAFSNNADVAIDINYSIPINPASANITYKIPYISACPACPGLVYIYCLNKTEGPEIINARGSIGTYTDTILPSCYDTKNKLTMRFILRYIDVYNSQLGETNITWYLNASYYYEFEKADTKAAQIRLKKQAEITDANFNISGLLKEAYDQQSNISISSYIGQPGVVLVQSFQPSVSNLSKLYINLAKNSSASSDVKLRIGTTINGSEIFNTSIVLSKIPLNQYPDYNDYVEIIPTNYLSLNISKTYYISIDVFTTNGVYWRGSSNDVYLRGTASAYSGTNENKSLDFAFKTYTASYPTNSYIEVGQIDGVREWNWTNEYTLNTKINLNKTSFNNYLLNCTQDSTGYCNIPIYFVSETPGYLAVSNIQINYTYNPNPVYLDIDLISSFLGNSTNFANIPIKIESSLNGTLQINDIRLDYAGGNKTTNISVYFQSSFKIIAYWAMENQTEQINPSYYNLTAFNPVSGSPTFDTGIIGLGSKQSGVSFIGWNVTNYSDNINFNQSGVNYTISFWVNHTKLGVEQEYFDYCNSFGTNCGSGGWALNLYSNNKILLAGFNGSGTTQFSTNILNSNVWNYIVITKNSSSICLYINGTLDNCRNGVVTNISGINNRKLIMGVTFTGQNPFNGTMDEVGIWTRTLDISEIFQLWNDGLGLHYDQSKISPSTLNITNYYSKWNFNFPRYVNYLEFIPKTSTSKNVTPYGQTSNTPIFNLTTYNYGGKNMNLFIYLNETFSCVNLTASITLNKSDGFLLNNTWKDFKTNLTYLNNSKLWLWADYSCNYTYWRLWKPDIKIRGCCSDCVCSEEI